MRRVLHRHQEPLIGLRQPRRHRAVGRFLLRFGLLHLLRVEVQRLLLKDNGLPGEVAPHGLVEVLKPGLIDRQKRQRVPEQPGRVAARLQNGGCRGLRLVCRLLAVGVIDTEHDEAGVHVVGHVRAGWRQRMDAAKLAGRTQVGAQPLVDLLHDRVRVALELLGPILGELGDRRLGRVPVARAVLIEVGRRGAQAPQRIAEDGGRLARHDAAELDPAILDAAIGRGRRRGGAEIDRPRHPPAGGELAEVGHLAVDAQRQRARPVHVLLDDRLPGVGQIARQLVPHARIVDRQIGGHDQRVAVALLPQAVDHRRHQAQHAAGALELHQRGPVGVEPVEHFRMDRIGRLDPVLVVEVAALGREFLMLGPVEVVEGAGDRVARDELGLFDQRLEQPPPDDLEAFLGAGRRPRRLHPPDDVAQPRQRRPAARAAHLLVVGLRVRRGRRIGGGQADDQQTMLGEFRRLPSAPARR